jgi:hypothetical protein
MVNLSVISGIASDLPGGLQNDSTTPNTQLNTTATKYLDTE